MPKKSKVLPPPEPDSHFEEAAILTRIFKKEPFITYRELLERYKSEISEHQALSGILGLFSTYVDIPDDDPLFPQLVQAKQAALQMEVLSHPIGGKPHKSEKEIQALAKTALQSALADLPAGLTCYFTCYAVAACALSASGSVLSEPFTERLLFSTANQHALTQYSIQTDSVFRNLPKLLPEEENEVFVGKSAGKSVSTIVTMDFPKSVALDSGGYLTNFDKAILNGISSLLITGTVYFTIPMLYHAMSGNQNPSMREEAVQMIRERLEFMRHSTITLDCTEEAAAHFLKDGQTLQGLTLSRYLLPMNRMNAVLNGRDVEAYFLIDTPPLFQYASSKRQISLVDMALLNVHFDEDSPLAGTSLNNTPAIIVLKNYLLTRIEGMKNPNNRLQSRKILFSSVYEELGEASPTKQRRQRLRKYTEIYLEYLTQQHYISGFGFTRTGRIVDGVEIFLNRTTGKPAPTPELTVPDDTNKGRFKPKERRRNIIR